MGGVFTENQPDYENTKVAETIKNSDTAKVDKLKTQITTTPETLDKVSKKDLEELKTSLTDKDKAKDLLVTTLLALNADTKGIKRGDKKTLENIRDIIIESKAASLEDAANYQLETVTFKDYPVMAQYWKFFNTSETSNDWYKNISEKGVNAKIQSLFAAGGEFADKSKYLFTAEQFQKELYKRNTERVKKITDVFSGGNLCIEDYVDVTKLATVTKNDKETLTDESLVIIKNEETLKAIKKAFPSVDVLTDEYAYILEQNPTIFSKRQAELVTKVNADNILAKMDTDAIITDATENLGKEKVAEAYLKANTKDAIYLFNTTSENSKLTDISTALTTAIALNSTNTKLTELITKLKTGDFKGFQTIIYGDNAKTSTYGIDGKLGQETLDKTNEYIKSITTIVDKTATTGVVKTETVVDTKAATTGVDNKTTTTVDKTATTGVVKTETTSETVDVATLKKDLLAFDITKAKTILASGVLMSDYKKLFTAAATGTDAQVTLANTYMKALINGDQNISDVNTDKQPGILTFQKICSNLGQDVIYTPVKTRIEKALADKAIDKNGTIVTSVEFFKNGVVDFVALQKILTQIGENIEYGINAAGKLVKGKATRDEKTQKMSGFYVKNGILYTSAKDGKTIMDVGYDTKTKLWTINPTYKLEIETPKMANNTAVAESTSTRGYTQNLNIK